MSRRPKHNLQIQETLLDFIREKFTDSRVYIHFTGDKSVAEKILSEGFRYSESFAQTTSEISLSKIDIKYKIQLYREYGNFLIVICLPIILFETRKTRGMDTQHDTLYNLGLSDFDPGEELEYKLPPQYIFAYIDLESNSIYKNEQYS
jgi:hypothetical protein